MDLVDRAGSRTAGVTLQTSRRSRTIIRSNTRPSRSTYPPGCGTPVRCYGADSRAGSAGACMQGHQARGHALLPLPLRKRVRTLRQARSSAQRATSARTTSCPRSTSGSATSSHPNASRRPWTSLLDAGRRHRVNSAASPARRTSCDSAIRRVAKYRALLDAGVDATLVAGWIKEVTATRQMTERRLTAARRREPHSGRSTATSCVIVLTEIGGLVGLLAEGDQVDRARFYEAVRISGTYEPQVNRVDPQHTPCWAYGSCRRGDLNPHEH